MPGLDVHLPGVYDMLFNEFQTTDKGTVFSTVQACLEDKQVRTRFSPVLSESPLLENTCSGQEISEVWGQLRIWKFSGNYFTIYFFKK